MTRALPIVSDFDPETQTSRRGRQITCAECGATDMVTAPAHAAVMPIEPTIKKLQQRGWVVGKRSAAHRCPNCHSNRKMKMTAPQKTPSPAASKRITDLYMLLEDNYDRAARTYRGDWTDAKIAGELDLDVGFVAKRREQDFGPVVVPVATVDPAAVSHLDNAVSRLEGCITSLSAVHSRLQQDLEAVHHALAMAEQARDLAGKVKSAIRK